MKNIEKYIKNKKAVSETISIILIILLILLLIFIIWNVFKNIIKENIEISEIKSKMIIQKIDIYEVKGDLKNPESIQIKLHKGPGKIIIEDKIIIENYADIVFIIDSTSSMGEEIEDVIRTINEFVNILKEKEINYRLGLIEFRDYPIVMCGMPEDFPSMVYDFNNKDFTKDINEFSNKLNQITLGDGNDKPEAHLTAIKNASENLVWGNQENLKKIIILLSDAPPHAKDCFYNTYLYSTYSDCYKGPETIKEMTDKLIKENIIFYYINKIDGLCNDKNMLEMVKNTNGKFYEYDENKGIENIIPELANQIIINYKLEEFDHLKIIIYNSTDQFEYKLYDMPLPLETKEYTIPETIENFKLYNKIKDINKIEIYQVINTKSGKPIISQLLDSWELEN